MKSYKKGLKIMEFKIYKLIFSSEFHIGNGLLADSEYTMYADTLFSALCQESLKQYGEEGIGNLVEWAEKDQLFLSDGFPYMKDTLFLPKPIGLFQNIQTSSERKAYKKMKYVPSEYFTASKMTLEDLLQSGERLEQIGTRRVRMRASIMRQSEPEPYGIGCFRFKEDNGMYFIIGTEESRQQKHIYQLFKSLKYTGLGGKVSGGMGQFDFKQMELPQLFLEKICFGIEAETCNNLMTLSVSLPAEKVQEVLENSYVSVIKRSGYVASENYTEKMKHVDGFTKKKDSFVFQAGSCIGKRYKGSIIDVSDGGMHSVWRYAKSLFWRLDE